MKEALKICGGDPKKALRIALIANALPSGAAAIATNQMMLIVTMAFATAATVI